MDKTNISCWTIKLPSNTKTRTHKQFATMYTKLPPAVTSIILLILLDERQDCWPNRANGWAATASKQEAQCCSRPDRWRSQSHQDPRCLFWLIADQPQPAGLRYDNRWWPSWHTHCPEHRKGQNLAGVTAPCLARFNTDWMIPVCVPFHFKLLWIKGCYEKETV